MVSHRRTDRLPRAGRVRGVCTVTAGAAAVGMAAAWAPSGAQAFDAASVGEQVQALRAQAEETTQQYDQATADYARLQQRIDGIQAQAAALQLQVNSVSGTLGRLAAAQYRGGSGLDPTLQLILAQQPDQFLQHAAALDAVGRSESIALRNVRAEQQQLTQFRAQAATDLAEQTREEQQAAAGARQDRRRISAGSGAAR